MSLENQVFGGEYAKPLGLLVSPKNQVFGGEHV